RPKVANLLKLAADREAQVFDHGAIVPQAGNGVRRKCDGAFRRVVRAPDARQGLAIDGDGVRTLFAAYGPELPIIRAQAQIVYRHAAGCSLPIVAFETPTADTRCGGALEIERDRELTRRA